MVIFKIDVFNFLETFIMVHFRRALVLVVRLTLAIDMLIDIYLKK